MSLVLLLVVAQNLEFLHHIYRNGSRYTNKKMQAVLGTHENSVSKLRLYMINQRKGTNVKTDFLDKP